MRTYLHPAESEWQMISERPHQDAEDLSASILRTFSQVEADGDSALIRLTEKFDQVTLTEITASSADIDKWADSIPEDLKQAIDVAYANITTFHVAQKASLQTIKVETQPGVVCWREARPIEKVGLYVPGGSAPLFSTMLMLGVPAHIAGCKEIVLCTPPQKDGSINAAICYAARLVGVTKIIKVGGAQAIAALTVGTASVPVVDKLFGPGNSYVMSAKLHAAQRGIAIDMPAGPSEVMVIADESSVSDFVAADLLSQAEHGPDSQVVLVTTSEKLAKEVDTQIKQQLDRLPRKDIAEQALNHSLSIVLEDIDSALRFANIYSPEHLILSVRDANTTTSKIQNAGSVFLGNYTPESAGDYASGTNHTLPTNRWARSYSGLSLESFSKYITFQYITKDGAKRLAPTVMIMAEAEGLDAHKEAMRLRLDDF